MTHMSNCEHGWSFTNTILTAFILAPLTGAAWYGAFELAHGTDLGQSGTLLAVVGSVAFPAITFGLWTTKH